MTAESVRPRAAAASGFLDIYGISYALGLLFLVPAVLLLGTQPLYAFNGFYVAMLTIPPIAATVCLLATEPVVQERRNLASRSALIVVLAVIGSLMALVVGTPVVVIMFVNGVGHSRAITGLISAAGLVVVSSPMVWSLVSHLRAGAWVRAGALLMGIALMIVVTMLTLSNSGFLVDSMRRDQGEIMMGLLEWCLPAFAVTTAFIRRSGLV
jgi:hypothetical protein